MDDHSSLSSSLTDMMTSLMVIFILLLTNYLSNEQGAVAVARSKTEEMKAQLESKLSEFKVEGVEVKKIDDYNLVIIIPDKLLFDIGASQLNANATDFLSKFTPALIDSFSHRENDIGSISVEGNTDRTLKSNAPKYLNWDLSQARASAVMKNIFESQSDPDAIEKFKKLALFGGRGPIECDTATDANEEAIKKCRTVKFKIRMKSNEEKLLLEKTHVSTN